MIYTAHQTRILREVSDSAGSLVTETDVLQWTNDASRDIATRTYEQGKESYLSSVAGQESYSLPAGLTDVSAVAFDGVAMERLGTQEFFELAAYATAHTTPSYYTLYDNALYIQAPPDQTGKEIRLWHGYTSTDVASVASTASMPFASKHDAVIAAYCKARAYEKLEDPQMAGYYNGQYELGIDRIQNEHSRYEGAHSPQEVF